MVYKYSMSGLFTFRITILTNYLALLFMYVCIFIDMCVYLHM